MNISDLNWATPNSSQSIAIKFINLKEILESFNHIIDICDYE
ncbi:MULTISPECIES: hypothetical protein [Photobacterium]|nr:MULTISPECIES: hypothetical protein [Photobacterium]